MCRTIISEGQQGSDSSGTNLPTVNTLRLCWLALQLYENEGSDDNCNVEWAAVWKDLPRAVYKYRTQTQYGNRGKEGDIMSQLALRCLLKLQMFDNPKVSHYEPYGQWLAAFEASPEHAIFPDRLYEELAFFTNDTASLLFYRLRRLRDLGRMVPSSSKNGQVLVEDTMLSAVEPEQASDRIRDLIQADEVLRDDELLASTMLESIHQLTHDPPAIVHFILRCLEHRIGSQAFGGTPRSELLDLGRLTQRCWIAFMDAIADVIRRQIGSAGEIQLPEESDWYDDAVTVLFSRSPYTLTDQSWHTIILILRNLPTCTRLRLIASRFGPDSKSLPYLTDKLRHAVSHLSDDTELFPVMSNLLQGWFCTDACRHDKGRLSITFNAHVSEFSEKIAGTRFYSLAADRIHSSVQEDSKWSVVRHRECLRILLSSGLKESNLKSKRLYTQVVKNLTQVYTSSWDYHEPIAMLTYINDVQDGIPRADGGQEFDAIRDLFQRMDPKGKSVSDILFKMMTLYIIHRSRQLHQELSKHMS